MVGFVFFLCDLSITDMACLLILGCILLLGAFLIGRKARRVFEEGIFYKRKLFPTFKDYTLENGIESLSRVANDNIKSAKGQSYFPLLFYMFLFISLANCAGLVSYSFAITGQFIVTFTISLSVFMGTCINGFIAHGLRFFSMYLPKDTPLLLSLLLIPIEIVSFICKPLSLSIRLFANVIAGHMLIKILAGFICSYMTISGLLFSSIFLFLLFMLEVCVGFIQALVFTMLLSIYINEITALNH